MLDDATLEGVAGDSEELSGFDDAPGGGQGFHAEQSFGGVEVPVFASIPSTPPLPLLRSTWSIALFRFATSTIRSVMFAVRACCSFNREDNSSLHGWPSPIPSAGFPAGLQGVLNKSSWPKAVIF